MGTIFYWLFKQDLQKVLPRKQQFNTEQVFKILLQSTELKKREREREFMPSGKLSWEAISGMVSAFLLGYLKLGQSFWISLSFMTRKNMDWIWGSLRMRKLSWIRQLSFAKAILSDGILLKSYLLPVEI